jgi:hypothetical protein
MPTLLPAPTQQPDNSRDSSRKIRLQQFGQDQSSLAANEFMIVGRRWSIRSRLNAASSIAWSTKNSFAMLGLFGATSMSFRAAKIVAANKMANFLSSVTQELPHLE